jgi:phosphoglycerate dehydrogenase-like enzyme
MAWTVLATARAFWVSGEAAKAALSENGVQLRFSPTAGPLPEDLLITELQGCDAVIASMDPFNDRTLSACPQLKLVARCGVGIDAIDLGAATRHGVLVTNTPGAMNEAVADYTFGLILAVARRLPESDALMRSGGWGEFRGAAVHGKTLGLIGFGMIGEAVARRSIGFDMPLLIHDPWKADEAAARWPSARFVDLDTLLAESDFVSLHAPNTPETRGMVNDAVFARMKPSAYFINTARGALVEDAALLRALENRTIAGAAVDVYSQEPLPADHPLRHAPNCVLTPHNAFNTVESAERMNSLCAESVLMCMQHRVPPFVCNPEVLESSSLRLRLQTEPLR